MRTTPSQEGCFLSVLWQDVLESGKFLSPKISLHHYMSNLEISVSVSTTILHGKVRAVEKNASLNNWPTVIRWKVVQRNGAAQRSRHHYWCLSSFLSPFKNNLLQIPFGLFSPDSSRKILAPGKRPLDGRAAKTFARTTWGRQPV